MIRFLKVINCKLMLTRPKHKERDSERALFSVLVHIYLTAHQIQHVLRELDCQKVAHKELILAEFIRQGFLGMIYLQIHDLLCKIFFKETDCALGYYFLELLGIED